MLVELVRLLIGRQRYSRADVFFKGCKWLLLYHMLVCRLDRVNSLV